MTNAAFRSLPDASTTVAREFGRNYIVDNLPDDARYSVHLNTSHDDINLKQFDFYPGDNDKIVEMFCCNKLTIRVQRATSKFRL
jgi:hypothetical protein